MAESETLTVLLHLGTLAVAATTAALGLDRLRPSESRPSSEDLAAIVENVERQVRAQLERLEIRMQDKPGGISHPLLGFGPTQAVRYVAGVPGTKVTPSLRMLALHPSLIGYAYFTRELDKWFGSLFFLLSAVFFVALCWSVSLGIHFLLLPYWVFCQMAIYTISSFFAAINVVGRTSIASNVDLWLRTMEEAIGEILDIQIKRARATLDQARATLSSN